MNDNISEGKLLSEQFGVGGLPAQLDSGKTPDILAAEIRTIKAQTGRMVLNASIEVGRRLTEAKAKLPHGSWGEYLKNEVDYSPSQAQNLMRVFREYGSEQQSLFGGEAKSQTFGNLTYSKALSLLAIPDEEERERFAVENDVEHMSVRELNEAIKARNEAEERAAAAQDEADRLRKETGLLQEQIADQARVYEAKLTSANAEAKYARDAGEAAQNALERQCGKAQQLQNALSKANAAAQTAKEEYAQLLQELEQLGSRPIDAAAEVNEKAVEAARKAAVAEMTGKVNQAKDARDKADTARKAAEDALAAAQKELNALKAREPQVREPTPEEMQAMTAGAVEKARAEERERVKTLEKQLAAADPDTAAFHVLFDAWQDNYWKMMDCLKHIAEKDLKKSGRLQDAVQAAMERMARA